MQRQSGEGRRERQQGAAWPKVNSSANGRRQKD